MKRIRGWPSIGLHLKKDNRLLARCLWVIKVREFVKSSFYWRISIFKNTGRWAAKKAYIVHWALLWIVITVRQFLNFLPFLFHLFFFFFFDYHRWILVVFIREFCIVPRPTFFIFGELKKHEFCLESNYLVCFIAFVIILCLALSGYHSSICYAHRLSKFVIPYCLSS